MNRSLFPSRSHLAATAGGLLILVAASACGTSGDSSESSPAPDGSSVMSTTELVIIDVRRPEEFSEQHLEGAVNIDLQGPDFVDRIRALDRNGNYAVYCRSGNRSAQAVAAMQTLGFVNVTDYGSVAEASEALGVAVVS